MCGGFIKIRGRYGKKAGLHNGVDALAHTACMSNFIGIDGKQLCLFADQTFLILAVIAILEPSIINIMAVIGVTSWMGVARLVRAEVLTLKERDYVAAAKVMGAHDAWIIARHLIPNAIGPVLVSATLGVGGAILIESVLSFLGIGVQPPTPSWGCWPIRQSPLRSSC